MRRWPRNTGYGLTLEPVSLLAALQRARAAHRGTAVRTGLEDEIATQHLRTITHDLQSQAPVGFRCDLLESPAVVIHPQMQLTPGSLEGDGDITGPAVTNDIG